MRSGSGAVVEACVRAVLRGAGAVLAVTGEPGIGKTRLLDEVAARALVDGLRVHRGAAPPGPAPALAALGEALDAPASAAGPAAVLERLGSLVAAGPVAVLLDDLQWTCPAADDVLAAVVRGGVPAGVLLVLAARVMDEPPAWATAAPTHLRLGPLTAPEAAPLLAGLPAGAAADALRRSGGNPFYLTELVRSGASGVPPAILDAVAAEVDALRPAQKLRLRAAALAGEPHDPRLVEAAAGLPGPPAQGELAATGLMVDDGGLRFRRPVVAEAVLAEAGPAWRLAAHERVDAELARAGAPPRARAPHLERYARPGDTAAVAVLGAAAADALAEAPADAERWFGAALRLLGEAGPARVGLVAGRGAALAALGRLGQARTVLRGLVGTEPAVPAAAVAVLAEAEGLLGCGAGSRLLLTSALLTTPRGSADAALLHTTRAALALDREAYGLVLGDAVVGRAAALAAGDGARAALAAVLAAHAELAAGRLTAARAWIGQAAGALDAVPSPAVAPGCAAIVARVPAGGPDAVVPALLRLAQAEVLVDDPAEGLRHVRSGRALAVRAGRCDLEVALAATEAHCLAELGDLAGAAQAAEEALGGTVDGGHERVRALTTRMRVALLAGDLPRAAAREDEAVAAAAGLNGGQVPTRLRMLLAEVRLESGEAARFLTDLPRAARGPDLPAVAQVETARWYELLTRAALAAGDPHAAAEWCARAEAAALGDAPGSAAAAAARARTVLLLAGAAPAAAVEPAAVAAAAAGGRPLDVGRAGLLEGRALAAAGDRDGAAGRLRAAHEVLADAGARRLADEAAQLLRELGQRAPRRAAPAGAAGPTLSTREREVAELVATGLTNREIAESLYVSEKTVESHLGSAFRKLGVRSRTAVAAALRTAADPAR